MKVKKIGKLTRPVALAFVISLLVGCTTPVQPPVWNPNDVSDRRSQPIITETPIMLPTPDSERVLPELPTETQEYTVVAGDSLQKIARKFGVDIRSIIHANEIENPDLIVPGQRLESHRPSHVTPLSLLKSCPTPSWCMVQRQPHLTAPPSFAARVVT
ncbi:MAG: LysM domain-containing protein [Anaerolineaceae bacterium]|jgi:hypothetical protein